MRKARYLGARTTPGSDAKPLFIAPLFPGETVSSLRMSAYGTTLSDNDVSNPSELSWYGIGVPWPIVFATNMAASGAFTDFNINTEWDTLYEQWLLDTSQDGGEHWGGDADLDKEEVTGEETHSDEELIDSGPIGVYRFFSREVLMRPYAAAGNNLIRFGDDFEALLPESEFRDISFGQVLMFGVVRHDVTAETNFNVQLDDATSREAMGLLMTGDYTKVQAKIAGDTGAVGDFIRTTLFGGDSYIEASTIMATSAKMGVKATLQVNTPLQRQK